MYKIMSVLIQTTATTAKYSRGSQVSDLSRQNGWPPHTTTLQSLYDYELH